MRSDYEKAVNILNRQFGKDRKLYIATSVKDIPKVQIANTYYKDRAIYLFINRDSEIKERIEENSKVSLCTTASFHKFTGVAEFISNQNKYNDLNFDMFCQNHSDDGNFVLVKISIVKAFTYDSKKGYNLNFEENKVEAFNFTPYI